MSLHFRRSPGYVVTSSLFITFSYPLPFNNFFLWTLYSNCLTYCIWLYISWLETPRWPSISIFSLAVLSYILTIRNFFENFIVWTIPVYWCLLVLYASRTGQAIAHNHRFHALHGQIITSIYFDVRFCCSIWPSQEGAGVILFCTRFSYGHDVPPFVTTNNTHGDAPW